MPIKSVLQVGDAVSYADMANQYTVYSVVEASPSMPYYKLVPITDGRVIYSDCAQYGWKLEDAISVLVSEISDGKLALS